MEFKVQISKGGSMHLRKISKTSFNSILTILMASAALLVSSSSQARMLSDDADLVEVPADVALAPKEGFDDNDMIQVVLHGMLPNVCYQLDGNRVERLSDGKTIKIHQFARRTKDGVCADQSTLPEHMKMAVPYTTEVNLGQLKLGNYQFDYLGIDGEFKEGSLNVAGATSPTIDSFPYAAVTNAQSNEVVSSMDEVKVRINIVLNSSCVELDDNIRVTKLDDVWVVQPLLKVKEGIMCIQVLRPIERNLNLGKTAPGHHLIHVRSMNGKAVNKMIEVTR